VGGANAHKGIVTLIKAFNRIKNKEASLFIYGNIPYDIKNNIKLSYSGSIKLYFKGTYQYTDTAKVYSQFDVLLFPSICFETTGLVLLEAKYYHIPSIFSAVGGVSEYATNNIDGKIFGIGDDEKLATLVNEFIDNPELISTIKSKILPPRQMKETAAEYKSIYDKLIKNKESSLSINNYTDLVLYSNEEKGLFKFDMHSSIKNQLNHLMNQIEDKNIAIFGTGKLGGLVIKNINKKDIVCFFDNNTSLQGKLFHNIIIKKPVKIEEIDYILISSQWHKEINVQLVSLGYSKKQLISIHY